VSTQDRRQQIDRELVRLRDALAEPVIDILRKRYGDRWPHKVVAHARKREPNRQQEDPAKGAASWRRDPRKLLRLVEDEWNVVRDLFSPDVHARVRGDARALRRLGNKAAHYEIALGAPDEARERVERILLALGKDDYEETRADEEPIAASSWPARLADPGGERVWEFVEQIAGGSGQATGVCRYRERRRLYGGWVDVAVKFFPKEHRAVAQAEYDLLRTLSREPFVVGVVSAPIEISEGVALVLDWVPGATLKEVRAEHLPAAAIADIVLQIAHGLHQLATYDKVAHLDLKPSNLMLDRQRTNPRVVFIDLGVAQLGDQRIVHGHTEDYAAPEQLGDGPVGPDADRWALGLIAWELAVGRSVAELVDDPKLHGPARAKRVAQRARSEMSAEHPLAPAIVALLANEPSERANRDQLKELLAPLRAAQSHRPPAVREPVIDALLRQAREFETAGRHDQAASAYRSADKRGSGAAALNVGERLEQAGDLDAALRAYTRASERGVSEGTLRVGRILEHRHQIQQALTYYEHAAERQAHPRAFVRLATARYADALEEHAAWHDEWVQATANGDLELPKLDPGVSEQHDDARGLLSTAYDLGDAEAAWRLGKIDEAVTRGSVHAVLLQRRAQVFLLVDERGGAFIDVGRDVPSLESLYMEHPGAVLEDVKWLRDRHPLRAAVLWAEFKLGAYADATTWRSWREDTWDPTEQVVCDVDDDSEAEEASEEALIARLFVRAGEVDRAEEWYCRHPPYETEAERWEAFRFFKTQRGVEAAATFARSRRCRRERVPMLENLDLPVTRADEVEFVRESRDARAALRLGRRVHDELGLVAAAEWFALAAERGATAALLGSDALSQGEVREALESHALALEAREPAVAAAHEVDQGREPPPEIVQVWRQADEVGSELALLRLHDEETLEVRTEALRRAEQSGRIRTHLSVGLVLQLNEHDPEGALQIASRLRALAWQSGPQGAVVDAVDVDPYDPNNDYARAAVCASVLVRAQAECVDPDDIRSLYWALEGSLWFYRDTAGEAVCSLARHFVRHRRRQDLALGMLRHAWKMGVYEVGPELGRQLATSDWPAAHRLLLEAEHRRVRGASQTLGELARARGEHDIAEAAFDRIAKRESGS